MNIIYILILIVNLINFLTLMKMNKKYQGAD